MKITKHIFLVIMGLSIQSTFLAFDTVVDQNNSFKIINSSSDAAQKSIFQRVKQHLTDRFNDWRNGKNDLIKTFTNHAADINIYETTDALNNLKNNSNALNLNLTQDQQIKFKNLSTQGKQEVLDAWHQKHEDVKNQKLQKFKKDYEEDRHQFNADEGQLLKAVIKNEEETIKKNEEKIQKTEQSLITEKSLLKQKRFKDRIKILEEDIATRKNLIQKNLNSLEQFNKDRDDDYETTKQNFKKLHNAKREAFKKSLNKWLNADSSSTESTQSTSDTSSENENTPGPERSLSPEDFFENEEPETMESLKAKREILINERQRASTKEEKDKILEEIKTIGIKMIALKDASNSNPTTNEASNSSPTNQDETLEEAVARIRNEQNLSSQPRGIYFR